MSLATVEERPILENLTQLYIHDFSEHWAGSKRGELDDAGRFDPYPLDSYWREDGRMPLLVRVNGKLAGFALVNRWSPSGQGVDRNMAEFFIVRKHRRAGVGAAAAGAIFERYPGSWETAVTRRNIGAHAFWNKVIRDHPRTRDIDARDSRSELWDGLVFRFWVI
ncbi:MAG: GNAT family N-acetyltransferase [Caulobacteraceae bacterium]